MPFLSMNYKLLIFTARYSFNSPEAMCDGGILFYINRKVQKVLIFAAYLRKADLYAIGVTRLKLNQIFNHTW